MEEAVTRQQLPGIIDLVLSCSICQDTLSSIYATSDIDRGLRQGLDLSSGSINKLWLTECAHIICGKHLEGGGVSKGQYDSNIPPEYLQVPPPQLGRSGNEALRFQYVSLLRFASKVYERLLVSDKELDMWKRRESSIVACLSAMEPLSRQVLSSWQKRSELTRLRRALHSARERLLGMHGDVSFIDDVLHLAASLRPNTIVPPGHELVSMHNDSPIQMADMGTNARSVLARASAVDLEIVQNNAPHSDNHPPVPVTQTSQLDGEHVMKRRRLGNIGNHEGQHGCTGQSLQQRLTSRDAMPPPAGRLLNTVVPHSRSRFPFAQQNTHHENPINAVLASRGHGHCPNFSREEYNHATVHIPTFPGPSMELQPASSDTFEGTGSARSSFYWRQQENDGELDQTIYPAVPRSRSSNISPLKRLTLPPRTPSNTSHAVPRPQVGILANARTSQPIYRTPGCFQQRLSGRATGDDSQTAASPYFSNRTLATSLPTQSPYANRPTIQTSQHAPFITPRISSALAPGASTPSTLSWLSPSFRHDPHSDTQRASMTDFRCKPDAYRLSAGPRQANNQRLSLDSFVFTQQPQIDSGSSSMIPFANHGRRAARR
ncbi:MAG: hypothetical protein Q9218_000210 [Villophora microphyllina]